MFKISVVGRTVDVHELKVENKVGTDKVPYVAKSITFKVASNRNYPVTKVINGVPTKIRPTDFVFCKATGQLAQVIADYASERKPDGKIVSRHLYLEGHLETYVGSKEIELNEKVPLGDKTYNVKFKPKVAVDQTIFIVKELEFLDSAPAKPKAGEPIGTTNPTTFVVTEETTTPGTTEVHVGVGSNLPTPEENIILDGQGCPELKEVIYDENGDPVDDGNCPF